MIYFYNTYSYFTTLHQDPKLGIILSCEKTEREGANREPETGVAHPTGERSSSWSWRDRPDSLRWASDPIPHSHEETEEWGSKEKAPSPRCSPTTLDRSKRREGVRPDPRKRGDRGQAAPSTGQRGVGLSGAPREGSWWRSAPGGRLTLREGHHGSSPRVLRCSSPPTSSPRCSSSPSSFSTSTRKPFLLQIVSDSSLLFFACKSTARESTLNLSSLVMWRASVLLCFILQSVTIAAETSEQWGYVEIRHKAHVFWWYYKSPQRVSSPIKPWPTILWLEGGPGGSGVGVGNFQGIGPLDVSLKPRNSTWLQKADLIFVDLPVGVGYSYAEDPSMLATTDVQVAADATELLKALTKEIPTLHSSPLYLVGESYGGKLAAKVGISVAKAIHAGTLKLTLGGVVLGDSWISPGDFSLSYAQLLRDVSRLSDESVAPLNRMAAIVKEQIAAGQFTTAKMTWTNLLDLIDQQSDGVDMLNFFLDKGEGSSTSQVFLTTPNTIDGLMNGVIKEKLKVIPKNIIWQGVAIQVFHAMNATYMKPAIDEVDQLLAYGVNVSIYNGQLDVICSTIGVEAWVKKLKWAGLKSFLSTPRQALRYCDSPVHCPTTVEAYARSYQNLNFYWILGAGHKVPVDKPDVAVRMISNIVQSPDS